MTRPNKPTDQNQKDDWNLCEDSVIADMVRSEETEQRREALKRIGITSLGAFSILASFALWQASRRPSMKERRRGLIIPIGCQAAMDQLAYFHRDELDDSMARRVNHHLKRCKGCRIRYEQTYDVKFV